MPGKKESTRPRGRQADAHGRILRTAVRLFQNQGYSTTGINQIIAESESSKASFYYYYPSKEDLGREYIRVLSDEQLGFFRNLMKKHPRPADFVRAWLKYLKRAVRAENFFGCHMANFRAQLGDDPNTLETAVGELFRRTVAEIEAYLERARQAGHLPATVEPGPAARRLFAAYEGVVQIWILSGEDAALDDLAVLAEGIWSK